jgi:serine/threonine protein kinase
MTTFYKTKEGDIIKGQEFQYKLAKKLGEGTFGEVWLTDATPTALGVRKGYTKEKYSFALKFFKDYNYNRSLKSAMDEKNALVRLKDKELCENYSTCYIEDFVYNIPAPGESILVDVEDGTRRYIINKKICLVMTLVNGKSLDKYISDISLQQRRDNIFLIYGLLEALNKIHKIGGVTHQDIKEANIQYDVDSNSIKFLDWGGACVKSLYCVKNKNGEIVYIPPTKKCNEPCGYVGTLYTSPAMLAKIYEETGNPYIPQTFNDTKAHDIWSIGVVLFDWFAFVDNPPPNPPVTNKWSLNFDNIYSNGMLNDLTYRGLESIIQDLKLDKTNEIILKLLLEIDNNYILDNWEYIINYISLVKDGILPQYELDTRKSLLLIEIRDNNENITRINKNIIDLKKEKQDLLNGLEQQKSLYTRLMDWLVDSETDLFSSQRRQININNRRQFDRLMYEKKKLLHNNNRLNNIIQLIDLMELNIKAKDRQQRRLDMKTKIENQKLEMERQAQEYLRTRDLQKEINETKQIEKLLKQRKFKPIDRTFDFEEEWNEAVSELGLLQEDIRELENRPMTRAVKQQLEELQIRLEEELARKQIAQDLAKQQLGQRQSEKRRRV